MKDSKWLSMRKNEYLHKLEDFVNDNQNMDFRLRDRLSPMKKLGEIDSKNNDKKEIYKRLKILNPHNCRKKGYVLNYRKTYPI